MRMFSRRRSSKSLTVQIGYGDLGTNKHGSKKNLDGSVHGGSTVGSVVPEADSFSRPVSSGTASTLPMAESSPAEVPDLVPPTATKPAVMTAPVANKVPIVSRASTHMAASASQTSGPAPHAPVKRLVIGEGVVFEGTTEGCDVAVVGGKLRGTVKSRRLELMKVGKMEGMIIAETAEIAGVFEGNLAISKNLKV